MMKDKHNLDNQSLLEQMDACRPDSDDLSLPELRQLSETIESDEQARQVLERSQQLDVAIGQAFQDIDIPEGLKERLLARADVAQVARPRRARWVATGVLALATAASVALAVFYQPTPEIAFADRDVQVQLVKNWQAQSVRFGGEGHWPSAQVAELVQCYDLSYQSGHDVRLYQLTAGDTAGLPARPPQQPDFIDGWYVGFWQADGQVRVLAVAGKRDIYERIARIFSGEVA